MITLKELRARHRAELTAHRAAAKISEHEIRKRHERDLRLVLTSLADLRITQTEACAVFGTHLATLNQLLIRNGVFWPVKKQGVRSLRKAAE